MKLTISHELSVTHHPSNRFVTIYLDSKRVGSYDVLNDELGIGYPWVDLISQPQRDKIRTLCRAAVTPRGLLRDR